MKKAIDEAIMTVSDRDKDISVSHLACLYEVRLKILQLKKETLTKDEVLELLDELAGNELEILK